MRTRLALTRQAPSLMSAVSPGASVTVMAWSDVVGSAGYHFSPCSVSVRYLDEDLYRFIGVVPNAEVAGSKASLRIINRRFAKDGTFAGRCERRVRGQRRVNRIRVVLINLWQIRRDCHRNAGHRRRVPIPRIRDSFVRQRLIESDRIVGKKDGRAFGWQAIAAAHSTSIHNEALREAAPRNSHAEKQPTT